MDSIAKELKRIRFDMRSRIVITSVFLILALLVTSAGVLTLRIDIADAQRQIEAIESEMTRLNDVRAIFGNNLIHTLVMFVPFVGPIWGFFVLFNTGTFIALFSVAAGISPMLALVVLLFTPVLWLGFGVYSAAMAASIVLLLQIVRRWARTEIVRTCVLFTVCALALLSSAIIEWIIINI